MSDKNSAVPHADEAVGTRKEWQVPALRVLGAKFARNSLQICADHSAAQAKDNGNQTCS